MLKFINASALAGAVYLLLGMFVVFVLIPVGVDEPSNVEFAVLAPSYWPRVICIVLAMLGIGMLIRRGLEVRRGDLGEPAETSLSDMILWRVGLVIAGTFALYGVLETLGFVLTGIIALLCLMLLAGERRPLHLAIISLAVPLALYFFFTKAASIPIPAGILEPYLV